MPSADPGAPQGVTPADVERWLTDLGLEPVERAERDGIASWDLVLDGRRRFDLRVTVILDPALACICWAHYAPPINDYFRKSYRRLLRWNDEFPLAKFSVGEDERPGLSVERSIAETAASGADGLGLALARIVDIADRLLDESKDWLAINGRLPDPADRAGRNPGLLSRFEASVTGREPLAGDPPLAVDPPLADDAPVAMGDRA
jgi:hypothetical protein